MEEKIITVLELKEDERLKMRRLYTSYFRKTGRMSVYLMDPVIILGGRSDIRGHIPLPSEFHCSGDVLVNEYGTYFALKEKDAMTDIQKVLDLPLMPTGLHLDMEDTAIDFPIDLKRIRIEAIALASFEEHTFRLLYRRKLSMGI